MNGWKYKTMLGCLIAGLVGGGVAGAQEDSSKRGGAPKSAMGSPGTGQGTGVVPDLDYDGKTRDDASGIDDGKPDEDETRRRIRVKVAKFEERLDEFRADVQVVFDGIDPLEEDILDLPLRALDQHRDDLDDHLDDIARESVNLPGKPHAKLVDRMEKKVKVIHKQLRMLEKRRDGKFVLVVLGAVLKEIDELDESADGIKV